MVFHCFKKISLNIYITSDAKSEVLLNFKYANTIFIVELYTIILYNVACYIDIWKSMIEGDLLKIR